MLGAQLLYFFLLTVLATIIVSIFVVWRYGVRVLHGMRPAGGAALALPAVPPASAAPPRQPAAAPTPPDAWQRIVRRRVVAAWTAVNLLAALPVAVVYLWASGELARTIQVIVVTAVIGIAAVPVIVVSLGWGARRGLRFLLGWLLADAAAVGVLSLALPLLSGRLPEAGMLMNVVGFLWLAAVMSSLPALLMLLGWPSRIRYVVPMVFGSLVMFAVAPFLGSQAFEQLTRSDAGMGLVLRHGGLGLRHAVFAVLALPFAALVAWRLHRLAAAYAAKRFSDVQLLGRAWWLMFVGGLVAELVNAIGVPWWGGPACALAGCAYLPIGRAVLRRVPWQRGAPPVRTLLLLRAFGWRARTERLVDRIGARWRWRGPITMIAAPDVVARSIDPADLLGYVRGEVDRTFVRSEAELQARLAAVDTRRDPDGRFRINEFCCADTTWQATVVRLMERADVVLMDLRGLGQEERAGCVFELEQLALRVAAARVVLVVDGDTHLPTLRAALGPAAGEVRLHRFAGERGERGYDGLMAELVAAAG